MPITTNDVYGKKQQSKAIREPAPRNTIYQTRTPYTVSDPVSRDGTRSNRKNGAPQSVSGSLTSECTASAANSSRNKVSNSVAGSSRSGMPRSSRSDASSMCSGASSNRSHTDMQKVLHKLSSLEQRLSQVENKNNVGHDAEQPQMKSRSPSTGTFASGSSTRSSLAHKNFPDKMGYPGGREPFGSVFERSESETPMGKTVRGHWEQTRKTANGHSKREPREAKEGYVNDSYGIRRSRFVRDIDKYPVEPGGYILRG